jgi:hypothetical protein
MEGDTPGTSFDGGRAAPPEGSVSGVPVVLQGSPKRGPDAPMVTRSQHEYQFTLQTMKLLIDFNNTRNPASKSRLSEAHRCSQRFLKAPIGSQKLTKAVLLLLVLLLVLLLSNQTKPRRRARPLPPPEALFPGVWNSPQRASWPIARAPRSSYSQMITKAIRGSQRLPLAPKGSQRFTEAPKGSQRLPEAPRGFSVEGAGFKF